MTSPNPKARELLPCPFCGGKAKTGSMEVYCSDCGMGYFSYAQVEQAELADRWNRRTPDGEVVAEGYAHKAEIRLAEDGPPWLPHGVTVNIWHDKANDYYAPVRLTCLVPLTRATED